ncbi:hypothetical protein [Saccharothrix sp. HUAS TT1]|uniref:hypothetical protein n=1 Tax=unclassified Saccharothrix TaxID=2593673 RepID=UPI00345B5721
MHISDRSVYSHTYVEVASASEVSVELLADDHVEVFVGERSDVLGVTNGVTMVLGEGAIGHLLGKLTEGLDALKARS